MGFHYDINNPKKDKTSSACLLTTHAISEIVNLFLSTFLVGYVYSLSSNVSNYIFNVGIYYATMYAASIITHLFFGYIVARTNRVWLYRLGVTLRAALVVLCVFCGKDLARLLPLAGVLSGISEAIYYSAYNTMKQEMVSRHAVKKYVILSMTLQKIINIAIPLALGALLDFSTYSQVAIYIAVIALIQIGVTFGIRSKRPEGSCFSFKRYFSKLKQNPELAKKMKLLYIGAIPYGLSTIVGVLLNISIMMQFESNFSLGWLTSIFAVASTIFLLVLNKFTHAGKRAWLLSIISLFPVIGAVSFAIWPNMATIIVYNLLNAISNITFQSIYDIYRTSNLKEAGFYSEIQEHQTITEIIFCIMRTISFGVLLLLGLTQNLLLFKIFFCIASTFYLLTIVMLIIYERKFAKPQPIQQSIEQTAKVDIEQNTIQK